MRLTLLLVTTLAVTPAVPSGQAIAQRSSWFDVTVGLARPLNGRYRFTAGPAIDANFAFQVRHAPRRNPFLMMAATGQGGLPNGDKVCVFDGRGGCLENLPSVHSVSVLLGIDWFERGNARSRWSADVSTGPGISWVNGDDFGEHVTVLSWHGDSMSPPRSPSDARSSPP